MTGPRPGMKYAAASNDHHSISFGEAVATWARIAALSFGGPAGQIAVMHRILVEEKRWIGEDRFLHALNYCMLLPGPEAQQLAIYIGWLLHRTKGGLVAGTLFVLPGFLAIMALSYAYALLGHLGAVEGLFFGMKAAVLAIVLQAMVRVGSRALRNNAMRGLAAIAFIAIFVLHAPFPLIVLGAALTGYAAGKAGFSAFRAGNGHGPSENAVHDRESALGEHLPAHARPNLRWSVKISFIFLLLWLVPVALLFLLLGPDNIFTQIAGFFSQMAVVTFGGAYAVLAYVAQEAVSGYGWLRPGEMLDGLAMAETTPGPLIMVTQFVGFMAAYRDPGPLNPLAAATLGGLLTTWVTFTPCFLWIFAGAPFLERLRHNAALSGALAAITAAVAGVIANLALWFAIHTLFGRVDMVRIAGAAVEVPDLTSLNMAAAVLTVLAIAAAFRLKIGVISLLAGCSAAGVLYSLFG